MSQKLIGAAGLHGVLQGFLARLPSATGMVLCAASVLAVSLGTSARAQSAAGTVYVSSEKDNKIYVFDAAGKAMGSIATCERPRHMEFDKSKSKIYVICGDSNAMGTVDVASKKMTGTMALGESPEIAMQSPDGKTLYVSIEDENALIGYDLASKKEVLRVKTGGEPEGVFIMPDGKTAYVTSEEANLVHVIDLASKKIIKNIKVGNRPRRFAYHAASQEMWVTNELSASVSIIDTSNHAVKGKVEFAMPGLRANQITPVGVAFAPDGKSAWVTLGRANHVAQVDAATKKVLRTVLVGKRAWGLAFNKSGDTLYVANGLSDDMTLVDAATGKALKSVAAGRVPHTIVVAD